MDKVDDKEDSGCALGVVFVLKMFLGLAAGWCEDNSIEGGIDDGDCIVVLEMFRGDVFFSSF